MFVAHLIGPGEGCDYTIGCNNCLVQLPDSIKTMDQAEQFVLNMDCEKCHSGQLGYYGNDRVAQIVLYEVKDRRFADVIGAKRRAKEESEQKRKEAAEQAERDQFERLKKKYGS